MNNDDPAKILMKGSKVWNAWRKNNLIPISFAKPFWYNCPGPGGKQLKGINQLNFSQMNFFNISIYNAYAEGLDLRNSTFIDTHFEEGDFSRTNFSGATFHNTKFNKTILTGANFDGATFVNCNLNRVNLVEASFRVQEITETVVYGISAWDLQTSDDMKQSKLVIEKTYELYSDIIRQGKVPMMVDNIELAQFIHYLSNHKKMRDTLNILNDKGVLLLGQFRNGGLERLYSIREWFHQKGYMAMIFDFTRPDYLSLTDTIVTMAGLSKFIVADLSGPSVPAELNTILSQIKKPVLAFGNPYSLFPDLADKTKVIIIKGGEKKLLTGLEAKLTLMENLHNKRIKDLAKRYKK